MKKINQGNKRGTVHRGGPVNPQPYSSEGSIRKWHLNTDGSSKCANLKPSGGAVCWAERRANAHALREEQAWQFCAQKTVNRGILMENGAPEIGGRGSAAHWVLWDLVNSNAFGHLTQGKWKDWKVWGDVEHVSC